jgi:hypothetical protein
VVAPHTATGSGGEWYRAENLRKLFTRHAKVSETGAEIRLPAVLVPDAANPHDDKAVAVFVDGLHVGYMERPDAKKYHRHISDLPGGELGELAAVAAGVGRRHLGARHPVIASP